jgi:hypothetical protein
MGRSGPTRSLRCEHSLQGKRCLRSRWTYRQLPCWMSLTYRRLFFLCPTCRAETRKIVTRQCEEIRAKADRRGMGVGGLPSNERVSTYSIQAEACSLQTGRETTRLISGYCQGTLRRSRFGEPRTLGMDRVRRLFVIMLTLSVSNTRMPIYDPYGYFSIHGKPICVNCFIALSTPAYSKKDVSMSQLATKLSSVCSVCLDF